MVGECEWFTFHQQHISKSIMAVTETKSAAWESKVMSLVPAVLPMDCTFYLWTPNDTEKREFIMIVSVWISQSSQSANQ